MSRRLLLVALLLVAALAAVPVSAGAATERASLPDIEDEVMCVQCGTALNISTSAVADDEREFIAEEIAKGRSKEEIKEALVDEYGPGVLAMPDDRGFGLAAYVVPPLLALLGLLAVAMTARRWRRTGRGTPNDGTGASSSPPPPDLDPADLRRLDAELAASER